MSVWRIAFYMLLLCGVQERGGRRNVSKKMCQKKIMCQKIGKKRNEQFTTHKQRNKTLKKRQATKIPILLL